MPRATLSTKPKRFELKSLPEGYVLLRRMTYGERLHRQDIAMSMSMQQERRTQTASMEIKQAQTKVGEFELATCIVEHNLEKDDGSLLNFKNGMDFQLLDGAVGEEIASYIEDMHNWENDLPNSSEKSADSSSATDGVPQADNLPIPATPMPAWRQS